jgi:hypothetical protein
MWLFYFILLPKMTKISLKLIIFSFSENKIQQVCEIWPPKKKQKTLPWISG